MTDTPPRLALPPPGDVAVWWWALDLPADEIEGLRAILSPDEEHRAARFMRPADAARFVAARGRLRELLAAYTGVPSRSLQFEASVQGKPRLAAASLGQAQTLRFNLSHSGPWAAAVVAGGVEVGIDIEVVRPVERAVARRFFAPEELEDLEAQPLSTWLEAFHRCWTRKEAVLKASGHGLGVPLTDFAVTVAAEGPASVRRACGALAGAAQWTLLPLSIAAGVPGAVAVASPEPHRVGTLTRFGRDAEGFAGEPVMNDNY